MSRDNNGTGGGKNDSGAGGLGVHVGMGGSFSSSDLSPSNNSAQVSADRSRHVAGQMLGGGSGSMDQ